MKIIRPGNQSYSGVVARGQPISHAFKVRIVGAPYEYVTSASPPQPVPAGTITHVTGAVILKISNVDQDGKNWNQVFAAMRAGDQIIIGSDVCILANPPVSSDGQWNIPITAEPVTVSGPYIVKVNRP